MPVGRQKCVVKIKSRGALSYREVGMNAPDSINMRIIL